MLKNHHSIKYFTSKLFQIIDHKLHPGMPWLTKQSIFLLNELIKKSDSGVEFGSGRSTCWFASRCDKFISIENNETWFNIVKNQIAGCNNVQYYFKQVNENDAENSNYLDIIDTIEDSTVDFVLDDGKLRSWVALKMLNKLKQGGLFILDNAERYLPNYLLLPESLLEKNLTSNWSKFLIATIGWRRIWTSDGVSSTLILFKP